MRGGDPRGPPLVLGVRGVLPASCSRGARQKPVFATAGCRLGRLFHGRSLGLGSPPDRAEGCGGAGSARSLVSSSDVALNRVLEGEQGGSPRLLLPSLFWMEILVFCACVSVKREADQSEGKLGSQEKCLLG